MQSARGTEFRSSFYYGLKIQLKRFARKIRRANVKRQNKKTTGTADGILTHKRFFPDFLIIRRRIVKNHRLRKI